MYKFNINNIQKNKNVKNFFVDTKEKLSIEVFRKKVSVLINNNKNNNQKFSPVALSKLITSANSNYKSLLITKKERSVLIQSIRYNNSFVMPYITELKIIHSLAEKSFIERKKESEFFSVKKNVQLLFEMEGDKSFDEILEPEKRE